VLILALGALTALAAVGVNRWTAQSGERAEPAPPVNETASQPALTPVAPPPRVAEIPAIDPLAPPAQTSAPTPTASALALAPTAAPTAPTTREAPTREPPPDKVPPPEKTVAVVEKPVPTAVEMPAPAGGAEFDKAAAKAALASAASRASVCKPADDPGGGAKVSVTFAPSGRVTTSRVTGAPYQGTTIGGCIAAAFRSASIPPFDGAPVTVSRDVNLH
jgi:hypothetical protein